MTCNCFYLIDFEACFNYFKAISHSISAKTYRVCLLYSAYQKVDMVYSLYDLIVILLL